MKREATLGGFPQKRSKTDMVENLRKTFEEAMGESLGVSAKEAIIFYLRERIGEDPFKALLEDHATFYRELERIFGNGATILIKLFADELNKKFNLKHPPETFIKFLTANDKRLLADWCKLLTDSLQV